MIVRFLYLLFFINVAVICFNADDNINETQTNKEEIAGSTPEKEAGIEKTVKSENNQKSRLTMI